MSTHNPPDRLIDAQECSVVKDKLHVLHVLYMQCTDILHTALPMQLLNKAHLHVNP